MKKTAVGILGATGMAGQRYIQLLEDHPFFEIKVLAASSNSVDKTYEEAVAGRWNSPSPIPQSIRQSKIISMEEPERIAKSCDLVFSAVDTPVAQKWEPEFARAGLKVVSNASAYRKDPLVPVLIPEINPGHLSILDAQRKAKGFESGFITVKPNCSLQSYLLPLHILDREYELESVVVTTLQALSGAGYPGVSSMNIIDNCIPFIPGEEEKSEQEPLKILGDVIDNQILAHTGINITAHCNRVPVLDGHMACVSASFRRKPEIDRIFQLWESFRGLPQELKLPSAPLKPVHYAPLPDRPQPRLDRDLESGMAITVGRLRPCGVHHIRFVGLSHNTLRGAAGGGVLIAELLKVEGYL